MSPSPEAAAVVGRPGRRAGRRAGADARRVQDGLRRAGRARAQRGRAGDVLAAVERALRLQALQEAAAHAADRGSGGRHGAGRERRRRGRRRRLGGRVQGRVAQPPERRRAVPGRGHRRRRDPARHLRAGRAADRGPGLAALRRADVRALALPAGPRRRRASGTTATRSACRPWAARSSSRRRTRPTAWSTRWPSGWRGPTTWSAPRRPALAMSLCCSARPRGATASAARRCWRRPSSTSTTTPSARRCRSATRSRSPSSWSARWSCWRPGCWWPCRTWARRA